jgi:hypothetical protein
MIYSVFNYTTQRFDYFDGPGVCPPHGWFRRPSPGALRQPEELAAALPEGSVPIGSGALPKGVIATDVQGLGTRDTGGASAAGAGLSGVVTSAANHVPVASDDPWDDGDNRGWL